MIVKYQIITNELKREIIYLEDSARIFEIMIEISERKAALNIELSKTENNQERSYIKGEISILSTLQNIIDKRIDGLRAADYEKNKREMLMNRQFRIAAEAVLHKETFEKIKELSLINYKKLKDAKEELRANKME